MGCTHRGAEQNVTPTKNVIFMLTDGTSTSLISAARWYKRYMTDTLGLSLAVDPYLCGLVQSRQSDAIIPDSAPAMSAYMTGIPCRKGNVSIYPEPHPGQDVVPTDPKRAYQPAATVLEAARIKLGKSVGVVATAIFPHATPGATAAHSAARWRYHDIATQMAAQDLDVCFGGGRSILTDEIRSMVKESGATLLEDDPQGFRDFKGDKLWAIFNEKEMDYEIDRDPAKEPSLSEMTAKALEILSKNKKGFFLMVEGSKVDYGAHSKDPVEALTEFIEFDNAIKVAVDFAKKHGNTTVVITSDHGNSGLTLGDANYKDYSSKGLDSMFVGIKNCHTSSTKMAELLQECRESEIPTIFKDASGITLTQDEIEKLKGCMDKVEGDYMKVSNSWNIQSQICKIYTSRTHIGFTSGNHTGEDTFLAAYNPKNQRPTGIILNSSLNKYVCDALGLKEPLVNLTDEFYVPHTELFEDYKCELVPSEDYPTLVVYNGDKTLRIPAYHAEAYLTDEKGKVDTIKTTTPAVYMVENGKFYVDSKLGKF